MKSRRKLYIQCPQCQGGNSKYYYKLREEQCSYCKGNKDVDILFHFRTLDIHDERLYNVEEFIQSDRFFEYMDMKNRN